MRGIFHKTVMTLGVMILAVPLSLFPAATQAQVPPPSETITYPSDSLGNPSDIFINNPPSDKPNMDNSLFPSSSVTGNSVTVNSGLGGNVYGGITPDHNVVVKDNTVTITAGTIGTTTSSSGTITGGWSRNGNVTGNKVFINDDGNGNELVQNSDIRVRGIIYGGWVNEGVGSEAGYNIVTINGSNTQIDSNIYGAYTNGRGKSTGNQVIINDGDITRTRSNRGIMAGGYSSSIGGSLTPGEHVTGNEVVIKGGTIDYFDIYGGRGRYHDVFGNTVTITGGTISNSAIYGGQNYQAGNVGNVTSNRVNIGGANTVFTGVDVYGGRSGSGMAINNTIVIGNDATNKVVIGTLYGGYVASGGNNAFSGNTLNKNSAASMIGTVRNVNIVNFGYNTNGNANIDVLDTTATGVSDAAAGVTIRTNDNDDDNPSNSTIITFDGRIEGSGSLTKTGDGTANDILILTNDGNRITNAAGVTVQEGRLEIGDGGTSGNLVTPRYTVGTANTSGTNATLAYNRNDAIVYGGLISDASGNANKGILEQAGTGTLTLTGDGSSIGRINITGGTLQLGAGGASGSINAGGTITNEAQGTATGGVHISGGAALAYSHSDAVTDGQVITGQGKVIQRGSGSLELIVDGPTTRNLYTGGTEIESGGLLVGGVASYNQATDAGNLSANTGTSAGYITFTGASGAPDEVKYVGLRNSNNVTMRNSFRTWGDAGHENYVVLTRARDVGISDVKLTRAGDTGGAFYVAGGTTMNVVASRLQLQRNSVNVDINGDGGTDAKDLNDLYVENGGTFNLLFGQQAVFKSGISGEGTLNLEAWAPNAVVQLVNDDSGQTFAMGETNLYGSAASPIALNLARAWSDAGHDRVMFTHTGDFNSVSYGAGAVTIIGDGVIQSDTGINMGNGTALIPYRSDILSASSPTPITPGPDTLTLDAPRIALDNFTLAYLVTGAQTALTTTGLGTTPSGAAVVKSDNTGLLDLVTTSPLSISDGAFSGIVDIIQQVSGNFTPSKDYLIMRSKNDGAFDGMSLAELQSGLKAYVGGAEFKPTNLGLRGSVGFRFGGDPDANGEWQDLGIDDYKNVWLTTTTPNSLTMSWTGGAAETAPADHLWTLSDSFFSYQKDVVRHAETSFVGGDKVYISGANSFTVTLPGAVTSSLPGFGGGKLTVSGLVAGRNVEEDTDSPSGGVYTIAGAGGITANEASAFGKFVNASPGGEPALVPTGKLEKFGGSTLRFENTGANLFMQGIELSGGTTSFTRADQLTTWAAASSEADATITGDGVGITFKKDATLEARENITLTGEMIKLLDPSDPTASVTGTFSVAAGKTLTIGDYVGPTTPNGQIVTTNVSALLGLGISVFNKTGPGTVRLEGIGSGFAGRMDVSAGTLHVAGDYTAAGGFAVKRGGTLSGAGSIGAGTGGTGIIESGGTLKPDGLTWSPGSGVAPTPDYLDITDGSLNFNAASSFTVRLAEYYGDGTDRYSDRVNVPDGIVAIDPAATLAVDVDYYKLQLGDTAFYTVIDAGPTQSDKTPFTLASTAYLPRGVTMEHGWGLGGPSDANKYQIGAFRYNPDAGFGKIPGLSHNQNEVGNGIDDAIKNQDPGLKEVVDRLSDPGWDDGAIRRQLDELSGDLTANAFYIAFKEPWRHPFNRLTAAIDSPPPPAGAAGGEGGLHRPRVWAELVSRYEDVEYDGNAHGFSLHRHGLALGVDTRISPSAVVGAAFRYTNPHLRQSTGQVEADDFEIGVYGLKQLTDTLNLKGYLGYSHQEYRFSRTVSLPATPSGTYGAAADHVGGHTGGNAVAASVELIRPIQWRDDFRLLPVIAFDYEKAWLNGYKESAGLAPLAYDDASMERLTFRFGVESEFKRGDTLTLKARAQYLTQLNDQKTPAVNARFANVARSPRTMGIHGVAMDGDYLNLGLGATWAVGDAGDRSNKFLYLNYDTKFNDQATIHSGEAGFMITW